MRRLSFLLIAIAGLLIAEQVPAQPAEPSPAQLGLLAELLRDPAIQTWLETQAEGRAPTSESAQAGASERDSSQGMMAGR